MLLSPLPEWDIRNESVLFRMTWDERKHLVHFQQGHLLHSVFFKNKTVTVFVVTYPCIAKQLVKYFITDVFGGLFHLCKLISGFHRACLQSITFIIRLMHSVI